MPDYRLRIGMTFKQQGRILLIERCLPDGTLAVKDLLSGDATWRTQGELVNALFERKLELLGDDNWSANLTAHLDKVCVGDLSELAEEDPLRLEAIRRRRYVERIRSEAPIGAGKEYLTELIRSVGEQIGDAKPPSSRTVRRWLSIYMRAGEDIRALMPGMRARGNRHSKITGKKMERYAGEDYEKARFVDGLIDQVIKTRYLSAERPTVASIYENLRVRISDENQFRAAGDHLPIPNISSLYRRIRTLDPYDVDGARHGRRYADNKHRAKGQGPRPAHPLERVECDHTRIDLMVVDAETRLPLGRPWLTAMLDIYSMMVMGVYLSFHAPGYLSVMQCMRHAIRPKGYVKDVYPAIEHDWPAYGLPELLVVDNGKEFHSRDLDDACLQLGIKVQHAPPYCPWYKGAMERWFGTQNTRLLHELPGTTFSDIFDRGDYDPQKHAVISLDALLELVHSWIVDLYHMHVQRGAGDIPYRRWNEAIVEWPPNLPRRDKDLDVLTGPIEWRQIRPAGIELFCLRYNCPELTLIRHSLKDGEKVKLKYDPMDLSMIRVYDAEQRDYIEVPALDQAYTRGLSLHQHDIIKKYARRMISDNLDVPALCRARKRIEEIVARERIMQKRLSGRQKAARFHNVGQPDYSKMRNEPVPPATTTTRPVSIAESGSSADLQESAQSSNQITPATFHNLPIADNRTPAPDESGWSFDYSLPRREGYQR